MLGPGVAFECEERRGLHVNEDHFIAEVIDPVTLAVKRPGEEGELVLTTITKEGFPLVRYRTGDLTALDPSPCPCGRTLARIARIQGRIDDMINLGDVKVFPSQVEEVIASTEGVEPHYELIVDRVDGIDTLEVRVEIAEDMPGRRRGAGDRAAEGAHRPAARRLARHPREGHPRRAEVPGPGRRRQAEAGRGPPGSCRGPPPCPSCPTSCTS